MGLIDQLNNLLLAIKLHVYEGLMLLGVMWSVQLLNVLAAGHLAVFGVRPRQILGLPGIVLSPWIHGSFDHIFFNSIPLFVLFVFMMTLGNWTCLCATVSITLLSGTLTWLLGRTATHIGASGLIMGYVGYILADSYLHQTPGSFVIGAITIYYFGSSLLSVLPTDEAVSYEGHLFGLVSGIFTNYYGCIPPFSLISSYIYML